MDIGKPKQIGSAVNAAVIDALCLKCWQIAEDHGWHQNWNDGEKVALMHSELSEHLEALRRGRTVDEHCGDFFNDEIELADLIIRAFDYAKQKQYRLGQALLAKMKFNESRPYRHGKAF